MKWRSRSSQLNKILRWSCVALLTFLTLTLIAWVAAKALIVRSDLAHADALVMLAGSSTYLERARHAARLFNEGRAPRILLANDNMKSGWSAEKELNPLFVERAVDELKRLGVPAERIEVVPGVVSNTHEEAVRVREYASQKKLGAILVITSAYHSRRALWTMRRAFRGSGIEIGLDAVNPGEQSPGSATWWCYRLGWQMVPGEYLKIIYYRLKY